LDDQLRLPEKVTTRCRPATDRSTPRSAGRQATSRRRRFRRRGAARRQPLPAPTRQPVPRLRICGRWSGEDNKDRQRSSHPAGVAVSINQRARRSKPLAGAGLILAFAWLQVQGGEDTHTSWRGACDARMGDSENGWMALGEGQASPQPPTNFLLKLHKNIGGAMSTLLLRFHSIVGLID